MTGLITNLGRACGLILIFAAIVKAIRLENFSNWIHVVFEPLPPVAVAATFSIIALEFVVGTLVVWLPHRGAPFAVVMFAIFAIIHIKLLSNPLLMACPCFAEILPATAATQWGLLIMNTAALAVQIWIMSNRSIHTDHGE